MARSRTKAAKASKGTKTKARKGAARPKPKARATRSRAAAGKAKKAKKPTKAAKAPTNAARAKVARRAAPSPKPRTKAAKAAPRAAKPRSTPAQKASSKRPGRAPTLDRERRRATDPDVVPTPPSSLDLDRSATAARSGRAELAHKIHEHTSTGPALTAGDVDADWESADSVGDEAPGGDNPTPDQDVVDEIGRSLGVEYDDDEELQGGDEIQARDRNRWELDPASADDFDERDE